MPDALLKILDGDLAVAGIPKRDDRGRTVDVHAMRHTFGTHLSKGGVSPRTAQAAPRHSAIDLTMNIYTDPRLLDVAGALDALPALPLDDPPHANTAKATGTDLRTLVPVLVPTPGNRGTDVPAAGNTGRNADSLHVAVSGASDGNSDPVSSPDQISAAGLEPATFGSGGRDHPTEPVKTQGLTGDGANACTSACTDEPESVHSDAAPSDFGDALNMIARLPLTDAEKAEAIRRLLRQTHDAGRQNRQDDS